MKRLLLKSTRAALGIAAAGAIGVAITIPVAAQDKVTVGVASFLTGGAAPAFGIPARNGSEVMALGINAGALPPRHWVHDPAQGGGRIVGEVCHFIDLLQVLAGGPPIRLHAQALPDDGRYRDDNVVVTLEFAGGSLGEISYVANGDGALGKERLEVFGGGDAAVLEDFRRLELVRHGRKRVYRSRWRRDKGYRSQWEAFARAVGQGSPSPTPWPDLVSASLATFRIHDSLRTGEPASIGVEEFMAQAFEPEASG